jgi:chromosome segregation ATPase
MPSRSNLLPSPPSPLTGFTGAEPPGASLSLSGPVLTEIANSAAQDKKMELHTIIKLLFERQKLERDMAHNVEKHRAAIAEAAEITKQKSKKAEKITALKRKAEEDTNEFNTNKTKIGKYQEALRQAQEKIDEAAMELRQAQDKFGNTTMESKKANSAYDTLESSGQKKKMAVPQILEKAGSYDDTRINELTKKLGVEIPKIQEKFSLWVRNFVQKVSGCMFFPTPNGNLALHSKRVCQR